MTLDKLRMTLDKLRMTLDKLRMTLQGSVGALANTRYMDRPRGTVTFLFSDIEGSTQRWERDAEAMSAALQRHDTLMRAAIEAHGGYVFKVMGDAFCAAFPTAPHAVAAAVRAQRELAATDFSNVNGLRVRMALHTGQAEQREDDYFGPSVNRVARLLAVGHGGQVLVSGSVADLLEEATPPELRLRDLGLHGLKDLARAERVFQVLAPELEERFPALRSLDSLPNNLPPQLTSFVGREEAVAEITTLLQGGRLVSLVGPGGVGKTRCALQSAAELMDSAPDGVWLVDLTPIADASLVTGTIAQSLGVRAVPNRPLLETLVEFLQPRHLLLVLDNCEHLLDEARRVVSELLRKCPNVRLLATSREPLNIAGEQVFRLPSLDVSASVALFADRAALANSHFALGNENADHIRAIVTRLDGMPLAIELAAARIKVLSPAQIAQRLDERFRVLTGGDRSALPHRQTLRATIDWSHDLLEERERKIFRRIAVFAGSFDLAAASYVSSAYGEVDEWETLDVLTALVDKSLVMAEPWGDEQRYRLLQSMREYGLERLREAGEDERIASRHAAYYARFVADLRPLAQALEDEQWRRLCSIELDNLRMALDWTLVREHERRVGIELLAELEWPEILTSPQEALRWYELAAAEKDEMPNAVAHACILRHCVLLEWLTGSSPAQRQATAELAVEIARRSDDPNELARALANLGACYRSAGRFDEAEAAFVEAYANPDRLSRLAKNSVLRLWAVTDLQRGNIEPARHRFVEVVKSERSGSESHASALLNLGELHYATGDVEAARDAARAARETYASQESAYLVLVLANLGAYALAAGDLQEAREHLREALDLLRRSGRGWLATVLEHHALLAALHERHEHAATIYGFTDTQHRARGEVRQHTEQRGHDRLLALLKDAYESGELERLIKAGAALSDQEALAAATAIYEVL
jgi:predicted ATPase/class 3 adenylate cyclase/Tfp pilus assembly protein PilF